MNDKRIPPAVGEFVVGEREQLLARIAELEAAHGLQASATKQRIDGQVGAQLAPPAVVPDGWQLMPKKLTPEMRMAWDRSYGGWDTIYQVLLAAAPSPAKASEPVTKLCMGCVEQSSRIRELEHKMDYYKSAAPASDVVQVPRDSLEDELLEAIEEWALTEDQTINVGDVELEGHDTHIESTAGYTVRLVRQLRALLNGGRDE